MIFRSIENLPVAKKFAILFVTVLIGIATLSFLGFSRTKLLSQNLTHIVEVDLKAMRNLSLGDMMHDGLRAVALRAIVAAQLNDPEEMKSTLEEHKEFSENIVQYMDVVGSLPLGEGVTKALAELKPDLDSYILETKRLVDLAAADQPQDALLLFPEYQKVFKKLEESMGNLGDVAEKESNESIERSGKESTFALQIIAVSGFLTLMLSSVVCLIIMRSIHRPVAQILPVLESVARGDLSQNVNINTTDELGQIARALNTSIEAMRTSVETINIKNKEMTQILDNTGQGFVTVMPNGTMGSEHSLIFEKWFGSYDKKETVWDHIGKSNKKWRHSFSSAWDQVVAHVLPLYIAVDQLPNKIKIGEQSFQIEVKPLLNDNGTLAKSLYVISDDSARIAQQKADQESNETMKIFQSIMFDRAGFLEFILETEKIVLDLLIPGIPVNTMKRNIHTIKGNTAIYGLTSVADFCHEWENKIAELGLDTATTEAKTLSDLWKKKIDKIQSFLTSKQSNVFEIDEQEYKMAVDLMRNSTETSKIISTIESWKYESTRVRLNRVKDQAEKIAERLGKPGLKVVVDHNYIRIDQSIYLGLWSSLIHVIRNAIDHGIEESEDRIASGKSPHGTLNLRTFWSMHREFCLEISDDGAGINWDKLKEKALKLGITSNSQQDLEAALFVEGVSTRDTVTDFSGRGVGMAAVKNECESLNGKISIQSTPGKGTTFLFTLPSPTMPS